MKWAHDHPEEYAEIARLPLREQNAALREAMGYDPDAIRERQEGLHHFRDLREAAPSEEPAGAATPSSVASAGIPSRRRTGMSCDNCGAPEDMQCQPWCLAERYS